MQDLYWNTITIFRIRMTYTLVIREKPIQKVKDILQKKYFIGVIIRID